MMFVAVNDAAVSFTFASSDMSGYNCTADCEV
jgi:hypothetical protein